MFDRAMHPNIFPDSPTPLPPLPPLYVPATQQQLPRTLPLTMDDKMKTSQPQPVMAVAQPMMAQPVMAQGVAVQQPMMAQGVAVQAGQPNVIYVQSNGHGAHLMAGQDPEQCAKMMFIIGIFVSIVSL